jgi:AcrR family transcriptional regulator
MVTNKRISRQIQAEERRLQILDAALTVFAEKGYRGTSIKDIAAAAGMSQGLMYHYFKSKEELLRATVEYHSFLPELRRILPDRDQLPAEQVLKEIANRFLDTLANKNALVKVLIRDVAFDPNINSAWANLCQEGVALLQNYVDGRIREGEFKPHESEVTARCMLATIVMFHFTRETLKFSRVSRAEYIDTVFDIILKGIANT